MVPPSLAGHPFLRYLVSIARRGDAIPALLERYGQREARVARTAAALDHDATAWALIVRHKLVYRAVEVLDAALAAAYVGKGVPLLSSVEAVGLGIESRTSGLVVGDPDDRILGALLRLFVSRSITPRATWHAAHYVALRFPWLDADDNLAPPLVRELVRGTPA